MSFMSRLQLVALCMVWLVVTLPFVSAQAADVSPPVVSNVQLSYQGNQTMLTWQTNEPATTEIAVGLTSSVPDMLSNQSFSTTHFVDLEYPAGTKVYYEIRSCDVAGNCAGPGVEWFVSGPIFVEADVPSIVEASALDVVGMTRPGADVELFVNGVLDRRGPADADGDFVFRAVSLPVRDVNLTLRASLNGEVAEKSYALRIDSRPPVFDVSVPAIVTSSSVFANITIDEPAQLRIEYDRAGKLPSKVTGLDAVVEDNRVELSWSDVQDVLEYVVYRDGIPIHVTATTSYVDTKVSGNASYQYQVSGISLECVGGDRSTITTVDAQGVARNDSLLAVMPTCARQDEFVDLDVGATAVPLTLDPGLNTITFTATDEGNHSSRVVRDVDFDDGPPTFEFTNLADIRESFESDITIRGKLSEPGAVTVIINDEPQTTEPTSADGSFEIDVSLKRDISFSGFESNSSAVGVDTGSGWLNHITLLGVDAAGFEVRESADVNYALCGEGSWFDVQVSAPLPDVLTPRLLLEGLQQIGFSFSYEYRGGQDTRIVLNPNDISAEALQFSPEFEDEWDNNLIARVNTLTPRQRVTEGGVEGDGYVQLELGPFEPLDEKNATTYDKEKAISDHRRGGVSGAGLLGRLKFYLTLNMPFQEVRTEERYDPQTGQTRLVEDTEQHVQKKCMKFDVMVDERVPPDVIPDELLEGLSDFFGSVIDIIDWVFDPIRTIGEYLFYACFGGTILMYFPTVSEKLSCEFSSFAGVMGGQGFSVDVASIGACDEVYGKSTQAGQNCLSCQRAKEAKLDWQWLYQQVCDRVMCPSPPSFQKYVEDKANEPLRDITQSQSGETLRAGSDCSAFAQEYANPTAHSSVLEAFRDYREHKDDGAEGLCSGLHPANAQCCGVEYMRQWSSSCGSSAFGEEADTFDELKESACLSAQRVGSNTIDIPGRSDIECGRTMNSAAGFCSPQGLPPLTPVKVVRFSDEKIERLGLDEFGRERFMHLFVIPKESGSGQLANFDVRLGYLVEKLQFTRSNASGAIATSRRHYFTADLEAIDLNVNVQPFFSKENIEAYFEDPDSSALRGVYANLAGVLSAAAGTDVNADKARQVFVRVVETIGTPDQEFIVRPDGDVLSAFQCMCFPTMIEYLKLAKGVAGEMKNCVDTVLLTGDGSPGMCEAMFSRYVCDLLVSAADCFVRTFSVSPPTGRLTGEGPDVLGALTSAGSDLGRGVESRYGDTGLYKAIFVDNSLSHSACMFAFTGDFEYDFSAAFDAALEEIPVASVAALEPCTRRFVGPALGAQRGYASWVYNLGVGLMPGSDVDVQMKLKCSDGYQCDPADGFVNGECDCNGRGAREVVIHPQGVPHSLAKGDPPLNENVFYTMMGNQGEGAVRYDRAVLEYSWTDNNDRRQTEQAECTIDQVGSVPDFCSFNPFTNHFECSFGNQPTSIELQDITPGGGHAIPQASYALGEVLNTSVTIVQEFPSPPEDEHVKHLVYELYNQNGNLVLSNEDRPIPLRTSGQYTKRLRDIANDNDVRVSQDWFGAGGVRNYDTATWQDGRVSPGDDLIESVSLTQQGAHFTGAQNFVLEFEGVQGGIEYSLLQSSSGRTTTPQGFVATPIPNAQDLTLNNVEISIPATESVYQGATPQERMSADVRVRLQSLPILSVGRSLQVHVRYNPTQLENPCRDSPLDAQPFQVKFTAFESDEFGRPTDVVAMDFAGNAAQKEATVYMACANPQDLITVQQAPPTSIPDLMTSIDSMIQQETSFMQNIAQLRNRPARELVQSRAQFRDALQQFILREEQNLASLQGVNISGVDNLTRKLDWVVGITRRNWQDIPRYPNEPWTDLLVRVNEVVAAINETIVAKQALQRSMSGQLQIPLDECPVGRQTDGFYECAQSCRSGFTPIDADCDSVSLSCCKLPENKICENRSGDVRFSCLSSCTSPLAPDASRTCISGQTCCSVDESFALWSDVEAVLIDSDLYFLYLLGSRLESARIGEVSAAQQRVLDLIDAAKADIDALIPTILQGFAAQPSAKRTVLASEFQKVVDQFSALSGSLLQARAEFDNLLSSNPPQVERLLRGVFEQLTEEIADVYTGAASFQSFYNGYIGPRLQAELRLPEVVFSAPTTVRTEGPVPLSLRVPMEVLFGEMPIEPVTIDNPFMLFDSSEGQVSQHISSRHVSVSDDVDVHHTGGGQDLLFGKIGPDIDVHVGFVASAGGESVVYTSPVRRFRYVCEGPRYDCVASCPEDRTFSGFCAGGQVCCGQGFI